MLNMHSLVLSWINKNSISLLQYTGFFFFLKKYITPDKYIMEFLLYCYYYVTWCDAWSDLSHENYLMCSTTAVVVFIKWEYINCGSAFLSWKSHKLKKIVPTELLNDYFYHEYGITLVVNVIYRVCC